MIKRLKLIFDNYPKRYFYFIFLLMIIFSLLEMISIGSFIPLVSFVFKTDNILIFKNYFPEELIFLIFVIVLIFKNIYSIYYLKRYASFLGNMSIYFQKKLFIKNLNTEYRNYSLKNSSSLIQSIKDEVNQFVNEYVDLFLLIFLNMIFVISLSLLLLFYNPKVTSVLFLFFFYFLFY